MVAHYKIPLDLPHAATVAERIQRLIQKRVQGQNEEEQSILDAAEDLAGLLFPYSVRGENPSDAEANEVRDQAAELGRAIVQKIVALDIGGDRLGQNVRNLFECLELGEEGAILSLDAGENPSSLQRPV